jgi:hypothetical protein
LFQKLWLEYPDKSGAVRRQKYWKSWRSLQVPGTLNGTSYAAGEVARAEMVQLDEEKEGFLTVKVEWPSACQFFDIELKLDSTGVVLLNSQASWVERIPRLLTLL